MTVSSTSSRSPATRAPAPRSPSSPTIRRSIRSAPASVCAGSRVQPLVGELQGEKIDIIPWSPDPASFIVNALQPAEVAKVVLDEDAERIEVVVPDEQLSLAIGRRARNVRLASQLTGWGHRYPHRAGGKRASPEGIQRSARNSSWMRWTSTRWSVRCSPPRAFAQVEELAYVELDEISSIEGFDEDTANELQTRAREYLEKIEAEMDAKRKELGVSDELRTIDGLNSQMLVALGEEGIKTIEDFAGCAADDLVGWTERKDGETKRFEGIFSKFEVTREEAETMIVQGPSGPAAGSPKRNLVKQQEEEQEQDETIEVAEGRIRNP